MEHIFIFDVNQLRNQDLFQAHFKCMPKERQEVVMKYKQEDDRLRSLGAGVVLASILKQYKIDFAQAVLEYGPNGKASVAGRPDIHFNLTHSGNYAAGICGVSPVGIDVEMLGALNERTAKRFFHDGEYRYLMEAEDEEERRLRFFRLWVLKESFMKATGLGMKLPLDDFEISISGQDIRVIQKVDGRQYYFKEFALENSRMAVCSADRPVAVWEPAWINL